MDHHELQLLLDHPAVRLLRANNAPLILGFLWRVFKKDHRVSLPEGQVQALLDVELDDHRESDPLAYQRLHADHILLEQEKISHGHAVEVLRRTLP